MPVSNTYIYNANQIASGVLPVSSLKHVKSAPTYTSNAEGDITSCSYTAPISSLAVGDTILVLAQIEEEAGSTFSLRLNIAGVDAGNGSMVSATTATSASAGWLITIATATTCILSGVFWSRSNAMQTSQISEVITINDITTQTNIIKLRGVQTVNTKIGTVRSFALLKIRGA
jgi:hypothetical protein